MSFSLQHSMRMDSAADWYVWAQGMSCQATQQLLLAPWLAAAVHQVT